MRQELSSKSTFFHKYIGPVLMIVMFIGAMIILLTKAPQLRLLLAVVICGFGFGLAIAVWFSMNIKTVSIDEDFIYVTEGQNNESKIPLAEIESVKQNRWAKPYPVTIRLRQNSPYGEKIMFIPKMRLFAGGFSEHPIVQELTNTARRKRLKIKV